MISYSCYKLLLLTVVCCFSSLVAATPDFDNSPEKLKTVHYVNHRYQEVNISDVSYKMPLNFKVYKISSGRTPYRVVNRYAIKAGQSVFINTSYRNGFYYVNELLIVPENYPKEK